MLPEKGCLVAACLVLRGKMLLPSATELQRAFLILLGTDSRQQAPSIGTSWQAFLNSTDLFPLQVWHLNYQQAISSCSPGDCSLCTAVHAAHWSRAKHPSSSSASPHALSTSAIQGAGACLTQLAIGDELLNVLKNPSCFPQPYVKDDNHSRAALNQQMLCFSGLWEPCLQSGTAGRQRGIEPLSVSTESCSPEGVTRQPAGGRGGKLGGDLVLQVKRGIKAHQKLKGFCHYFCLVFLSSLPFSVTYSAPFPVL